jgi:small nuclear ribonucleoprotein (snRNP)-like protein
MCDFAASRPGTSTQGMLCSSPNTTFHILPECCSSGKPMSKLPRSSAPTVCTSRARTQSITPRQKSTARKGTRSSGWTSNDGRSTQADGICFAAHSFFKTLVNHEVTVELKNDISVRGTLKSVDQYLNIKLDDISVVEEMKYPHLVRSEEGEHTSRGRGGT